MVFWADLVGAKHICARLTKWAQTYGEFFEPCAYLKERAASGVKLVRGFRIRVHIFRLDSNIQARPRLGLVWIHRVASRGRWSVAMSHSHEVGFGHRIESAKLVLHRKKTHACTRLPPVWFVCIRACRGRPRGQRTHACEEATGVVGSFCHVSKGREVDDVPYRHFAENKKEFGCVFCWHDGREQCYSPCGRW